MDWVWNFTPALTFSVDYSRVKGNIGHGSQNLQYEQGGVQGTSHPKI